MKISCPVTGPSNRGSQLAPIVLLLFGGTLLHFHLWVARYADRAPAPYLLWAGAIVISSSVWLLLRSLRHKSKASAMSLAVFVFLFALTLLMMKTTRYGMLNGTDITYEYFVARNTLRYGWSVEYGKYHYYYSLLSITILPSMLANVTGLSLAGIFMIVFQTIGAAIAVCVFLLGRIVFDDDRIAVLGSILYSGSRFYFELAWELTRFEIVTVLFLLTLYSILKRPKSQALGIATVLLIVGMTVSHLTQMYFFIPVLVSSMVGLWILRILPEKWRKVFKIEFSPGWKLPNLLPLSIVAFLSWLVFIAYSSLREQVGFGRTIIEAVFGEIMPQYHGFGQRIFVSSRGPVISLWELLVHFLTGVGVLYMSFKVRKRENGVLWMIWTLTFMSLPALWLLVPFVSRFLFLDRIYLMALPLLCLPLSMLLLRADKLFPLILRRFSIPRSLGREGKAHGPHSLLAVFIGVNFVMNISLPIYGNLLLYCPDSGVPPAQSVVERLARTSWLEVGNWIAQYVSGKKIYSDGYGELSILATTNELWFSVDTPNYPKLGGGVEYLLLRDYYLKYGYWVRGWLGSDFVVSPEIPVTASELFDTVANLICSNGSATLIQSSAQA